MGTASLDPLPRCLAQVAPIRTLRSPFSLAFKLASLAHPGQAASLAVWKRRLACQVPSAQMEERVDALLAVPGSSKKQVAPQRATCVPVETIARKGRLRRCRVLQGASPAPLVWRMRDFAPLALQGRFVARGRRLHQVAFQVRSPQVWAKLFANCAQVAHIKKRLAQRRADRALPDTFVFKAQAHRSHVQVARTQAKRFSQPMAFSAASTNALPAQLALHALSDLRYRLLACPAHSVP